MTTLPKFYQLKKGMTQRVVYLVEVVVIVTITLTELQLSEEAPPLMCPLTLAA